MFFEKADESPVATTSCTEKPYMQFYEERCQAEETTNPRWNDTTTFFHIAIFTNDKELIEKILAAPLELAKPDMHSLLHCAIQHNNPFVVKELLKAGATVLFDDFCHALVLKYVDIAQAISFTAPAASNPQEKSQLSYLLKTVMYDCKSLLPSLIEKGASCDFSISHLSEDTQLNYLYCTNQVKSKTSSTVQDAYSRIHKHITAAKIQSHYSIKSLALAVLGSYTKSHSPSSLVWAQALATEIQTHKGEDNDIYRVIAEYRRTNQALYLREQPRMEHTFDLLLSFFLSDFVDYTVEKNKIAAQALIEHDMEDFVMVKSPTEDPASDSSSHGL